MKRFLIFVLLLGSLLAAQSDKFQGYVMNPAAFRKIQSYCIDTHNLPAEDLRIIQRFVAQESKPKGLFTKLPWRRRVACEAPGVDAVLRMEFPHDSLSPPANPDEVIGALLVFRPGSPSPIYETPGVTVPGAQKRHRDEDEYTARLVGEVLKYSALGSVLRILIHDWQKL